MSKDGFRLHEKSHESGYTKCPEENCKGGGQIKRLRRDTTMYFTLGKFKNTGVSFAHSTNLLGQCGI